MARGSRLIVIFLVWLAAAGQGWAQQSFWQLTVQYDGNTLRILEAAEIPPMRKAVRTPGINGAPLSIQYQATWLDRAGKALAATATEFPLGLRAAMTPGGASEETVLPQAGTFVVRLAGPVAAANPRALRLARGALKGRLAAKVSLPAAFSQGEQTVALAKVTPVGAPVLPVPGPFHAQKILDTGADDNRLVLVLMGDGYTRADLDAGAFTTAANTFKTGLPGLSPWDVLFNCTNVYRIDVESNESGADRTQSSTAPLVDTYFNSSYWTSGIERLLAIDGTGQSRAIAAANQYVGVGKWDMLMINVNSTKYGGSGGSFMVYSNNSYAVDIIWHESGHTFAHLADEYSDPYPGFPSGDSEPNVDYDYSGSGLKWNMWVEAGTPLPTPATSAYASVVGAFEGARYLYTGIYRPYLNCEMRALSQQFCPICKEAHIVELFNRIQMVDQQNPAAGAGVVSVPEKGAQFNVTGVPVPGLTYQWALDGGALAGKTTPSITLTAGEIGATPRTLKVTVQYPTPLVRKQTLGEARFWTVQGNFNAVPAKQWSAYR